MNLSKAFGDEADLRLVALDMKYTTTWDDAHTLLALDKGESFVFKQGVVFLLDAGCPKVDVMGRSGFSV